MMQSGYQHNPGPTYVVDKTIMGSFHYSERGFGDTAGIQCACNSWCASYWSKVRKVFVWNGSNHDHILVEGNLLHKSLNTSELMN